MTSKDKIKAGHKRTRRAGSVDAIEQSMMVAAAGTRASIGNSSSAASQGDEKNGANVGDGSTADGSAAERLVAGDMRAADEVPTGGPASGAEFRRHKASKRERSNARGVSVPAKVPTGKNGKIVELVSRAEGAGIDELTTVTGWQCHTVRAALSRLRQASCGIELRTGEDGRRVYHHIVGEEASS